MALSLSALLAEAATPQGRSAALLPATNGSSKLPTSPAFVIAGVQKSGTTMLRYTLLHTQNETGLCISDREEAFSSEDVRNVSSRQPLLDDLRQRAGAGCGGDGYGITSPCFMCMASGTTPVWALFSDSTKFIVMLREPVQRAFNAWMMENVRKEILRPFNDAIPPQLEVARNRSLNGERLGLLCPLTLAMDESSLAFKTLISGWYYEQLQALAQRVTRARMLVLISEEIWDDPGPLESYNKILRFLGRPELSDLPDLSDDERFAGRDEQKESMSDQLALELRDFYAASNSMTYYWLGVDSIRPWEQYYEDIEGRLESNARASPDYWPLRSGNSTDAERRRQASPHVIVGALQLAQLTDSTVRATTPQSTSAPVTAQGAALAAGAVSAAQQMDWPRLPLDVHALRNAAVRQKAGEPTRGDTRRDRGSVLALLQEVASESRRQAVAMISQDGGGIALLVMGAIISLSCLVLIFAQRLLVKRSAVLEAETAAAAKADAPAAATGGGCSLQ